MPTNPTSLNDEFMPQEPLHPQGEAFFAGVSGMLDGRPKDQSVVEARLSSWDGILEKMASDIYRISSMLLGEGEDSVRLIEQIIAKMDISSCRDHADARHKSRLLLGSEAIAILARRDSVALSAPLDESGPASCIEEDDLAAAGVTPEELERMIAGPESHLLRNWLEGLTVSLRAIFVLRAVAGLSSPEVAGLLAEYGGPAAQDWTPDAVRSAFRQALCSLTSQLIHATATR
jgi:hypothetical protein